MYLSLHFYLHFYHFSSSTLPSYSLFSPPSLLSPSLFPSVTPSPFLSLSSLPFILQLEVVQAGGDPDSVAGEFGSHPLYKNIGYFSLIGLLRLHTQLGDYHTALESVANIQLSKKVRLLEFTSFSYM